MNLRVLEMDSLPNITTLPDLSRLTKLRALNLQNMKTLINLAEAGRRTQPDVGLDRLESHHTRNRSPHCWATPSSPIVDGGLTPTPSCEELRALIPAGGESEIHLEQHPNLPLPSRHVSPHRLPARPDHIATLLINRKRAHHDTVSSSHTLATKLSARKRYERSYFDIGTSFHFAANRDQAASTPPI